MLSHRRILLVITWMTDFSLFLLIFTVSRWLAESEASLLRMGVVGGVFSLTSSVASVIGGKVSDRVGRYRVILIAMVIVLLGETVLLLSMRGGLAYLVGYFVAGGAIGSVYPPIMAELTRGGDAVANRSGVGRTIILFCIAWNLGLISGQLTGGALFDLNPSYPLVVAVGLTLCSMIVMGVLATRPIQGLEPRVLTDAHHEHLALSAAYVPLAWLANLAGTFAVSMIFHLFPRLMVVMSIDPDRHGQLLAFSRVVIIATYLVMYRTVFWHHRFAAMAVSQVTAIAGLVVIVLAPSAMWLALGLALLGQLVGFNYFSSLYYSTTGSHDEDRGAASGMHEATLSIGFAIGCVLGGWTGEYWGDRSPYALAAAVVGVMLVVQAAWYVRHVRPLQCGGASPQQDQPRDTRLRF